MWLASQQFAPIRIKGGIRVDREVLFEPDLVCDRCGAIGAYDFMGDVYCPACCQNYIMLGKIKSAKELGRNGHAQYIWHACVDCAKERWVRLRFSQPTSLRCISCATKLKAFKSGEEHNSWKGGRMKTRDGYVLIWVGKNDFFSPMANKNGYILEHRLIMARHLNRCLLPWEVVHHKEGYAKDDNRYPQTLELLPHSSKHASLTRMAQYIKKLEREIEKLKVEFNRG